MLHSTCRIRPIDCDVIAPAVRSLRGPVDFAGSEESEGGNAVCATMPLTAVSRNPIPITGERIAAAANEFNALHKDEKELLQAYADGANLGLRQLKAKPFEYYLLGVEPRRWTPQNCSDTSVIEFTDAKSVRFPTSSPGLLATRQTQVQPRLR